MKDRIEKEELARRLATRMQTDTATAMTWIDGFVKTLYESFKAGESVILHPALAQFPRVRRRR